MNSKKISSTANRNSDYKGLVAAPAGDAGWQAQFQTFAWAVPQAGTVALAVAEAAPGDAGTGLTTPSSGLAGTKPDDSAGSAGKAPGAISTATALPTDPLLSQQWHLDNPSAGLLDLNVFGVWDPAQGAAYTGAGIRTVIIDDGFDYLHADLAPNYDTGLDYDFDTADLDPFGTSSDAHGTAVTGIIGADNNGTGAVGVAFNTSLVGYRTYGFISDHWLQNIRDAIHHSAMSAQGHVVNISQGIANDENSEFGVGYNAVRFDEIETSIATAVNSGRGGLGTIIVKSAGNSRSDNYDVNADDWSNDTRQVVVAAVDQNGFVSSYSSYGAAVLVSGFGTPGQVLTTDRTGSAGYNSTDFTYGFNGTSAAAPMVTGVVALMLDANAGLGWRDVQNILGASARQVGSEVGAGIAGSERYAWGWNAATTWNGGGQHFSNDYGFGLVDALAAVRMSETWLLTGTAAARSSNQFTNFMDVLNSAVVIPDGNTTGLSFAGNASFDDLVDRVTVTMTFSTTFTGDLEVYLTSPDGTVSRLIADTGGGNDYNGTWTFESQAFRGERAAGTWTVRVVDDAGGDVLNVSDIVIRTYGAADSNDRYVFTNEYSDYAGIGGHDTNVVDGNGGTGDTVNAAAVSSASVIRLDGTAGSIDGVAVSFGNIEHAIGGDGGDLIIGSSGGNQLFGMRGNDTLNGGSGTDTLRGGDGNDVLIQNFGGPDEIMDGGFGIDTGDWSYSTFDSWAIDLAAGTAKIGATTYAQLTSLENAVGGQLSDSIVGTAGANSLVGAGGNDTLDGGSGTDTLRGGDGNDVLIQNFGGPNEIMDGGSGTDTGNWSYSTFDSWVIDLSAQTAKIGATTYGQLVSIENAVGGQLGDRMLGNAGANRLDGQGGNDTLAGGGGADTLLGGTGDDLYVVNLTAAGALEDALAEAAASGTDTLQLAGSSTNATAVTLVLGANLEHFNAQGTASSLLNLYGNSGANTIRGNEAGNVIAGAGGADTLYGFGGNDTYVVNLTAAGGLEDSVGEIAGAGTDTLQLAGTSTNATAVTLVLAANLENLNAQNTGNSLLNLTGNTVANVIRGNAANNVIVGGAGVDTLYGFAGDDTYVVNLTAAGGVEDVIGEAASSGTDTLQLAGTSTNATAVTLTLATNLENLNAQGTGSSLLNLAGNTANNVIRGNGAGNVIIGAAGNDTLYGFAGNDTYVVNLTAAGLLEDSVGESAASGLDTLQLAGTSSNAVATTLFLAANVENFNAQATGSSLINLTGNAEANVIRGNSADNVITGGAGVDTLYGFAGNDTYVVNLTAAGGLEDSVGETPASGNDTLQLAGTSTNASAVTLTLAATLENLNAQATGTSLLNLTGNAEANILRGNAANNVISGLDGDDTLNGNDGNDLLVGGNGRDNLAGGAGNDRFDLNTVAESGTTSTTWDVIGDFTAGDTIDLSSLDADTSTAIDDAFDTLIVGGAFSGIFTSAGDLYFDNVAKVLWGNVDADAQAEFALEVVGVPTIATTDLVM